MTEELQPESERLRDEALARVEAHAHEQWRQAAQWVMVHRMLRERDTFTSFDLQKQIEVDFPLRSTHDLRALGPIIMHTARAGRIERVGYRKHPTRHASPMAVWKVVR